MASQSLYRKWRSQTFDDLVGQEPIVRTLKNALKSGNLAHAYLFTGPRGTGKTSTARLLAKTVNCANPKDGEPCNECQQCREIAAGNSFNVIEIDAASNRGIESIRDLREKVMMPPSTGKYKVYVLDEAHMLTTEAFNALLKTLEEPPPYAIFVLATTDVHKMLPTVLSRCQRFDFKRITTRQIVEHVLFVAKQEHIHLERPAAELIARAAGGGMRDALSLLDQAIAYSGEEISLSSVQAMLGVADPEAISKLIRHIAELNSSALLHQIHELSEAGADLRQINAQLVEFWRWLLLAKAGAEIASILDLTEDEIREVRELSKLFTLQELTECARIFAQNDLIQKNSGTPQLGLELASLESIELHRRVQAGQSQADLRGAMNQVPREMPQSRPVFSQPGTSISSISSQKSPAKGGTESTGTSFNESIFSEQEEVASSSANQEMTLSSVSAGESSAASAVPLVGQHESSSPSVTLQQVQDAWSSVKKRVKAKNKMAGAMLDHYKVIGLEGTAEEAVVVIQAPSEPLYKNMQQGERTQHVEWALTIEFSCKCRVRLMPPGSPNLSQLALQSRDFNAYSTNAANTPLSESAHSDQLASDSSLPIDQIEQTANVGAQFIAAALPSNQPAQFISPAESPSMMSDSSNGKSQPIAPAGNSSPSPVAKKDIVRENTPMREPQETIEQKVRRDPIVQEVMKTFAANIIEVRPK